jgi:hypothetical protein
MAKTKSRSITRDKDTRKNLIACYREEFGFTANAATTLHNVQMLKDAPTLSELDNDAIANICKVVSKDTGQSVAKIATTKLKLLCFWIRHQYWISREIGGAESPLVKIKYSGTIDLLQQQKQDKDNWASDNKEPEYTPLTLDTATTTKVFDKVKSISAQVCGVTGVPLVYVIRVVLRTRKMTLPLGKKTPSIPPLAWRQWPALLSSPMNLISAKSLRPSRPTDRLLPPF